MENGKMNNDTPRVTVPVEPYMGSPEALEGMKKAMIEADAPFGHPLSSYRYRTLAQAAFDTVFVGISAAPAPDEAVLDALDEALIYIERLGENIERNDLDMHLDTVERPFSFAQTMRGRFPSLCAALATRGEAPADHVTDAREMVEATAEAGKREAISAIIGARPWSFSKASVESKTDQILSLRAQPPAREDAQPKGGAGGEVTAALEGLLRTFKSHVDGRDLLDELHPRKTLDIKRRVDGRDTWHEGDWLSNTRAAAIHARAILAALQAEQGAK